MVGLSHDIERYDPDVHVAQVLERHDRAIVCLSEPGTLLRDIAHRSRRRHKVLEVRPVQARHVVAHALHELQYYLMTQQEELAQKVAQNPKDEAKKGQLKDVTDKIYDTLYDIRDALSGMCL